MKVSDPVGWLDKRQQEREQARQQQEAQARYQQQLVEALSAAGASEQAARARMGKEYDSVVEHVKKAFRSDYELTGELIRTAKQLIGLASQNASTTPTGT